jgi:hypothetical protein
MSFRVIEPFGLLEQRNSGVVGNAPATMGEQHPV